mgnify:CR=1 FL=1
MARVLIIGAGGVGAVVAHKCASVPEVFTEIIAFGIRTPARSIGLGAEHGDRQGSRD